MRRRRTAVAVTVGALLGLGAVPAHADRPGAPGDETEGGYTVEVRVTFSGDAAPDGGGGGGTIVVPATCRWTSSWSGVDGSDPQAVKDWVDELYSEGHYSGIQWLEMLGPRERFEEALERDDPWVWYKLECRPDVPMEDQVEYVGTEVGDGLPLIMQEWPAGTPSPEPLVDPEDLAVGARDVMVIDVPEIDRNPKVTAAGGGTFVDFPTWFWVTNPESVGGDDGQRSIRAEVRGSPVYAEVTARTDGLAIDAPGAYQECSPTVAQVEWSSGAAGGCVVQFPRASIGYRDGYPVNASTHWNATWEGMDVNGVSHSGALEALDRSAPVVNIPVAEVHTIVR